MENRTPERSSLLRMLVLRARARADHHTLPFNGWIVRGALGRAAHALACRCGPGDTHLPGCGFATLFDSPAPGWRLDASELDGRWLRAGDAWELRITGFGAPLDLLADAAVRALADGLGEARQPHDVESVDVLDGFDPLARAEELGHRAQVLLVTPADLRRDREPIREPAPLDVLHATRHRARAFGLPIELPWFEEETQALELWREWARGQRWSAERRRWEPVEGVRAAWNWTLSPAQAAWLAVAEVVGIGKHGTAGLGVVRAQRLADSAVR